MEINIGEIIHSHFEKKRIRRAALARLMNVDLRMVLYYEKKQSIATDRLLSICTHLKHNFFMDVASQLPKEFTTTQDPFEEYKLKIAQLEIQLNQVTIERDLMLKLMQK